MVHNLFQVIGVAALCSLTLVSTALAEVYSPRDFVSAAPADLFYTEDEMSAEEKQALVKSGFKKRDEFDCSAWGVAEETPDRLVLQYCADSSVTVQVYRDAPDAKSVLVAVSSVRASGRAGNLSLFKATKDQKEFVALTDTQLREIGVLQLTENDFLKDAQRFPASEAQGVRLTLGEKGELRGEPDTWMDPRWEARQQAFEVAFVWGKGRFSRQNNEISQEK
jgi:hypothetical protein